MVCSTGTIKFTDHNIKFLIVIACKKQTYPSLVDSHIIKVDSHISYEKENDVSNKKNNTEPILIEMFYMKMILFHMKKKHVTVEKR